MQNIKPFPAVDFLIPQDGNSKILLATRMNDPIRGMLSFPRSFINEGEAAGDAMRRKVKEESSHV